MSNNLTPLESPKLPLFPLQWSLKLVRQCNVPSSEHWLLVFELPCHNIKCLSTAAIATHDPPFPSSLLAPSLLPSTAVDLAPTLPAVGVNVWRDVHRFRLCRRGEDADDLPMRQWFGAMGVEQPPTITHACFVFVLFLPRLPHYHPMNLCTLPHLQLSTPSSLSPGAPPYHPIHPTKHAMLRSPTPYLKPETPLNYLHPPVIWIQKAPAIECIPINHLHWPHPINTRATNPPHTVEFQIAGGRHVGSWPMSHLHITNSWSTLWAIRSVVPKPAITSPTFFFFSQHDLMNPLSATYFLAHKHTHST